MRFRLILGELIMKSHGFVNTSKSLIYWPAKQMGAELIVLLHIKKG